ncbi:MAG: hypothetical protein EOM14_00285 [Clostridia bacterium]|nr:hypothetical protein [Clostridia bacterium]
MKAKKYLTLLLATVIFFSAAACGAERSGDALQDATTNVFIGRWVSDDDSLLAYVFDEELGFHVMEADKETLTGTYTYEENKATVIAGENGETSLYIELIGDGTITVDNGVGGNTFFRRVSSSTSLDTQEPDLGETLTTDNGNGTFTLDNFSLGITATYPAAMTVVNNISLTNPAILITDGSKGYCMVRDITEYYGRFSGTADSFATAYINDYIYTDFREIFGGYPDYTDYNLTHPTIENRLVTADIELYTADNDIQVDFFINLEYNANGNTTVTAIVFFAPRGEKEQMDTLKSSVTNCSSIN